MKKPWVKLVAAVAALFLLIVILVPLFVHADSFRPVVEKQLSTALGRQVTLGQLGFSLLSGSLQAHTIAIADDPAFSSSPFLQAKSLEIGVEVSPLLFHRQVHITKLTIDSPSISLLLNQSGKWNFSSLGGASSAPGQKPSAIPDFTVGELSIKDGSATVSTIPAVRKPFVYSAINLTVKKFSFASSFPFELTADLPASGSLTLKGEGGPLSQTNAADTPFKATLALKHFDPVASGVIDPGKGISMLLDLDSQVTSADGTLTSSGKINAQHVQLARTGRPTQKPISVDFAVSENLDERTGKIANVSVQTGSAAAYASGSFKLTTTDAILNLHIGAPSLPIDALEELLPAFGVQLPSGSQLKGGTLTANLNVSGPATATTISGPVTVANTTLAGFDLGSKIQGLSNLFKSGGGTQIQILKATVNSSPQVTQLSDIYGNLPQLGSATGSGSVTPAGAIDFKMVATLSSNNAVGAVANQAVNTVSNLVGGFLHPKTKPAASSGNKGIPLTITGTSSDPKIRANVVGMFK